MDWCLQIALLLFTHLYLTSSDASVPIGQNPSIIYAPIPNSATQNVFLIYNSAQGLESMFCEQNAVDPQWQTKCIPNVHHTLKCGARLYASALLSVYDPSHCNKTIEKETFFCAYYMVIGYGHADSSTTYVSFIICYDRECSVDNMEEVVIDTLITSASGTISNIFGYSISLTTYTSPNGIQYPMFTYSKYSADLKQFILNVILCTDVHCHTWIGKSKHSYASKPPYLTLGIKPGDGSAGKGVVSIKETWISDYNYVSVMFAKNVNITNNETSAQNVYVLAIATCALSSSSVFKYLDVCRSHLELQTTIINDQSLRINTVSMIEYNPDTHYPVKEADVPLFIAAYVLNNKQLDELWLLYCFNLFCNSTSTMYYRVRKSKIIDSAVITLSAHQRLRIVFFENSTSLAVMSCEGSAKQSWNCTDKAYNHPTTLVYNNTEFQTASMQITVANNEAVDQDSWILFSRVVNSGGGGGKYNGSALIQCTVDTCGINSGLVVLPLAINDGQFNISLDVTAFVMMAWIVTFTTIVGILIIYKCISPSQFMAKNVRNAYLNHVALDSARIRPLFFWFFYANVMVSAMCVVPWFGYFDLSNLTLDSLVIIAPFVPVILTFLVLIAFHYFPLTTPLTYFLVFISFLYWLSTILLSYSFGFVWNLSSENCQISDLSGLKIVILTAHIATCCVVQYLLFWNIRCFQALRLASPERLQESMYFVAQNSIVNDMDELMSYKVRKGNKTIDILREKQ